ncbi:MAG: phosphoribosylaminoimidazolesuccinocarboxamide synthase [Clostridia bacterium]|nr:phosphoribosylaminoimidazolesuccinocarboxamide synthase [Clostridia bacterium]
MEKKEMLYEGKAKKVYATEDPDCVIVTYKDDATAFNGLKKGTIAGKGVINNKMSNMLMVMLEKKGIPTHLVEQIDDRNTIVKKVQIVPLETIVRNVAAGSFSKRYGVPEGLALKNPTVEFSYKSDALGDPFINTSCATALGIATLEEIDTITKLALAVNDALIAFFKELNIDLVDFKLEFGRYKGQIILADEISPDTCRLWEAGTWDTTKHTSLDKDRFRRDLGGVEDAYAEVFKRISGEE